MTYYLVEHTSKPSNNFAQNYPWFAPGGGFYVTATIDAILKNIIQSFKTTWDFQEAQPLRTQISQLQHKERNLSTQIESLQFQINGWINDSKKQEAQLKQSTNTIDSLQSIKNQLTKDLDKATNETKVAVEQKSQAQQALEKAQSEFVIQKSENEKQKRQLEELNDVINTLKGDILKLLQQNADKQKQQDKEIADLKELHKDEQLKLYKLINNFLQNNQTENSRSALSSEVPSAYSTDNENPEEQ